MLGTVPVGDDPHGTLHFPQLTPLDNLPGLAEQGVGALVEHDGKYLAALPCFFHQPVCLGNADFHGLFHQGMQPRSQGSGGNFPMQGMGHRHHRGLRPPGSQQFPIIRKAGHARETAAALRQPLRANVAHRCQFQPADFALRQAGGMGSTHVAKADYRYLDPRHMPSLLTAQRFPP